MENNFILNEMIEKNLMILIKFSIKDILKWNGNHKIIIQILHLVYKMS